jgi:hypothetical protein
MKNYVLITEQNNAILVDETKLNHYGDLNWKHELTELEAQSINLLVKVDEPKVKLFAYRIEENSSIITNWKLMFSTVCNLSQKQKHFAEIGIELYFTEVEINND